ncbi:glycosyltransferase family 2 protein [Flavobacterium quisquiliarum]|uniref:Glycosyltransferase family 2 protein n=1 Tax=Flavobacterium quisquiliarum TaxID=1834436 RepID=A0ABV8W726_9FLAO|nr:glycosyltransferase family 2 protein [Flavobacterium quisquiliarum]MBW1656279.1 glycosyltransferase [Flavobacterium quisquiliarum]NWL02122.1 glycosyl transferase [Flavobacterium collinsii]
MNRIEEQKLSVLIITFNEERYIKSLIESIDFADEIIIVDSYSTDSTTEILKSFPNIKLIQKQFIDYTSQRNFAIDQAKNDWILFIDADEYFTPKLKAEIISTINSKDAVSAYFIYRVFMFKNRKLRFSGWQSDKIFRLFSKAHCRYTEDRLVHEKLIVNGKTAVLKNKLIHYSFASYSEYKMKMYKYGILKANEKIKKGQKPVRLLQFLHPVYTFLYQYLIRFGFLDGLKGITICYLNAYSIFIRYKEFFRITSSKI